MSRIDDIATQIRTAVYGKDVRENIALGVEAIAEYDNRITENHQSIAELDDRVTENHEDIAEIDGIIEEIDSKITENHQDILRLDEKFDEKTEDNHQDIVDVSMRVIDEESRAKKEEKRIENLFNMPVAEAVTDWLDEHPEATTTVQDKSLGYVKFTDDSIKELRNSVKVIFMPIAYYESDNAPGDCTVFVTNLNKKVVMIDSGAPNSYLLIKQELIANNISHIDVFILTHYHADHYNNIGSLIEDGYIDSETITYLPRSTNVEVSNWGNETYVRNTLDNTIKRVPNSSDPLIIDDLHIDFFNCDDSDIAYYDEIEASKRDCNNYSVCCYVTFEKTRILMAGDIQIAAEQRLYNLGLISKCDILKVPHHGYKDTTNSDFYLSANPDYSVVSGNIWTNQMISGGTLYSNRIAILRAINSKVFILGNGTINVGLHNRSYSFYPNGHEASSYAEYNYTMDLYVNQSYFGEISNGTSKYPFKTIQQALGYAVGLTKLRGININIVGNYEDNTQTINITSFGPELTIKGLSSNNVNLYSLRISNSNVYLENIKFLSTARIPLEYYDSKGRVYNCVISGNTRSAASISDSRGISVNGSTVYLDNCTISNKRMAIGCYADSIVKTSGVLYGENNEYLAYGIGGKVVNVVNSTIAYEYLTTCSGGSNIEFVYCNDKYSYSMHRPYTLFKDSTTTSKTVTIDLSDDSMYYRNKFNIYYGDGSVYTFIRWGGSISAVNCSVEPCYSGIDPIDISVNGKTIVITYSSIISIQCII